MWFNIIYICISREYVYKSYEIMIGRCVNSIYIKTYYNEYHLYDDIP